ncbi:tetratricopeptide repeat protein [Nisaea nitritireducens]|uniref:tetratricopeptide repeat protein n=1 Tax=Nisaea nitritireducens TaxID=568392 RepID=UPI0018677900|nr:tetratricopeptide repeat protein [Nisaea nitritireducens]
MSLVERILNGDPEAVREAEICLRDSAAVEDVFELRRVLIKHYMDWKGVRRDAGVNHLERDSESALRHMRAIHETSPEDTGLAHRLSSLLIENGRIDEALHLLEKLLETVPGNSLGLKMTIMESLARVLTVRGELERAATIFEQIFSLSLKACGPSLSENQENFFGSALARLSRIHVNTGNYAEAVRVIETFPHAIDLPFLNNTQKRARALLHDGPPSQSPDAKPVDLDHLTVACVKHGTKYGPDYVNRLYAMVRRHLPGNWRFVCLTDDPQGISPEIDIIDISALQTRGWWTKLALFDPQTPFADQTIFYLDLDTVIVGDLGFIEGLKVGFYILEHSFIPGYNSSVMLFDRTFAAPVHDRFNSSDIDRLVGDQDWIEECMPGIDTFPRAPVRLYKSLEPDITSTDLARSNAKIVTFPSVPKPHEIPHGWVAQHWQ